MPRIVAHAPYVTLINSFSVEPEDQAGLMRVQQEDIDLFGRKQPAFLAASFHRSLDGTRVFNYAQWKSLEGLAAWRQSPDFEAHGRRMAAFRFQPDPHPYQVVQVAPEASTPEIRVDPGLVPVLLMAHVSPQKQQAAVEVLMHLPPAASGLPSGLRARWVLRSLDGQRVAAYSQWDSEARWRAWQDSIAGQELLARLAEQVERWEQKPFEVGSTGHYNDPPPGT